MTVTLPAYAKINLYLAVKEKREDGYHNIESLMQAVSLSDTVTVSACRGNEGEPCGKISVECDSEALPCDRSNLAWRAADAVLRAGGFDGTAPNININLEKHIPVAAGLAGGSSDCAAVLKALNIISGHAFTTECLLEIGKSIGADVPFCIRGGAMKTCGIGEIMSPAASLSGVKLLICRPDMQILTKEAYSQIDRMGAFPPYPPIKNIIEAAEEGNIQKIAAGAYNMFELTLPESSPVFEVKGIMKGCGAALSMMSGSGPSVFGVFDARDKESLERAKKALEEAGYVYHECVPVTGAQITTC